MVPNLLRMGSTLYSLRFITCSKIRCNFARVRPCLLYTSDYKYRFLHTQINPHFIYNSLETINAIAKVNHTPEVSRIVQLIGKYFRNITKYSDHQFIALEKEFELLQCFIDIYKNIRGSNIEIRLDYPQELKSVEIPTLLLQPIVENSFVHGMRGMDELFIVCLSAKGIRDEQGKLSEMILSVEDNGIGMRCV